MQHTFRQFPELLFADATHKTNELWIQCYLMTAVDGKVETDKAIAISEEEFMVS